MLGASVSSCSKYEEGPNFALSSKKSRLVGEWKVVKLTINGTDVDLTSYAGTASIKEDGTYKTTTTYAILGLPVPIENEGKWEFNDDKTQVIFTETGQSTPTSQTILKLAAKELKLKQVSGSNVNITTYEPQ